MSAWCISKTARRPTERRFWPIRPRRRSSSQARSLSESQKMINNLNQAARVDIMRYANEDVEVTIERLKAARCVSRFRTRTQIVDPPPISRRWGSG